MKIRKLCILIAATVLTISVVSCILLSIGNSSNNQHSNSSPSSSPNAVLYYPSTYCYNYESADFISNEMRQTLNSFGALSLITTAEEVSERFTQIPEAVNSASGTPPIYYLLPELDLSKYRGGYSWTDEETGLSVSAYYRVVGDMLTDELVKIYMDSSNIVGWETVNLGKYDRLDLDESQLESLRLKLRGKIDTALNAVAKEFYVPGCTDTPSAYVLFTDEQGRLVIRTTAILRQDSSPTRSDIHVNLYAVVG